MARPVIGLTCYVEPARWGSWSGVPAGLLPAAYLHKIDEAGGIALLVPPPASADPQWARRLLSRLDGLVLAGGADVEPARYRARPHPAVQAPRRDRDGAELALVAQAVAADLPVLGICRGMQVLAVAAGGTLEQHVPDRVGSDRHAPAPGGYGEHDVRVEPGSRLGAILGGSARVPTYHHQAVAQHPGYTAVAWDVVDGTLEAMEAPDARWRVAVQWHPEAGEDARLFRAFVAAC
ncbi:MAG: gamma-glutamyl-gamma-aminobutyrate hydrolase family protein [Jatrophihabitans sp.]|nr:MAG: gamma-glutamyl-gamma-aminobutyrate hydrolase family protein [Jatrophihabitans sp.]